MRDALIGKLRQNGVESGGCGTVSMRVRPMLVFRPVHAQQLVDTITKSLKQL
jgi:4-aminobutyrate aminotransferase/(S)-3-amino-2-methylpropionate transaminase